MNIYQYLNKYKDISFKEEPLNEVDAMIFSFLAYATYHGILKKNTNLSIQEIAQLHIKMNPKKDKNIIAIKEGNKILHALKDNNRYKDCIVSNYEYIGNTEVQFCALTFEYQKNHLFVAFEGTDSLFSGWKENFLLGCQFPTKSHQKAIDYLNKHFTYTLKHLIIGGHSKGGNLALVASMYANPLVKMKIQKIYNGDGPGLLEKEFNSLKYRFIKRKYIHIIPNYSVVGLLLNHANDKVVTAETKTILSHNIFYWKIENTSFVETNLSHFSKELDIRIANWINNLTLENKKELVDNFEKITTQANIYSIDELKENYLKVFNLLYQSKDMSNTSKAAIAEFIKIIIQCIKDTQKEELKLLMTNLLKWKK